MWLVSTGSYVAGAILVLTVLTGKVLVSTSFCSHFLKLRLLIHPQAMVASYKLHFVMIPSFGSLSPPIISTLASHLTLSTYLDGKVHFVLPSPMANCTGVGEPP